MENHAGADIARALAAEVRAELAVQRRKANELAAVLQASPHTIGRRLSGKSPFSVLEMALTAEWLGLSPDALVRRAEQRAQREQKLAKALRARRALAASTEQVSA